MVEFGQESSVMTHPMTQLPTPACKPLHYIVRQCLARHLLTCYISSFHAKLVESGKKLTAVGKSESCRAKPQASNEPPDWINQWAHMLYFFANLPRRGLCWVLQWDDHSWEGRSNPVVGLHHLPSYVFSPTWCKAVATQTDLKHCVWSLSTSLFG